MMPQPTLFDAALSREARDLGLKTVSDNAENFMALAMLLISRLGPGEYTGEMLREAVNTAGLRGHSPNCYGAMVRTALKRGLISKTGRYTQMRCITSHARETPIYLIEAK